METLLVRLKRYDTRRGHILRTFTCRGIKILEQRGWYRVAKDIAEYLRTVRQVPGDEYTALAFDVCTEEEAKSLDAREEHDARVRRNATDDVKLSPARAETAALTTTDLSDAGSRATPRPDDPKAKRERG